ncbi:hypothetical protein MBCUT_09560 [Methanobrevibacter cuticularis]|uniref:Uncharacterized protein n=1 Tax=Methanobrevibacter cuticularis TaxID=47311 RepID=A0A166E4R4_9EURY|nr:hypothetical protein [Methanobrevibacter cuticularis]KZX16278.1 hypothetical protein MBCUT_09560 [Methanobrevibacter cuticularis]
MIVSEIWMLLLIKLVFMSNKFRKWLKNCLNGVLVIIKLKLKRNFIVFARENTDLSIFVGLKMLLKIVVEGRLIIFQAHDAEYFKNTRYIFVKDKHLTGETQFFESIY